MPRNYFSPEWATQLIEASADRELVPGLRGVVGFGVGKKPQVVVSFVDGRAVELVEGDPVAHMPFTGKQVEAWLAGDLVLAQAFTKGDLKATGPTGDLLAALELLDDRAVVTKVIPSVVD